MKNQSIILSMLIVFGLIGLMAWGWSSQKTAGVNQNSGTINSLSSLTAQETFYDLGAISMKNGNVSKVFKVANASGQDINLESVTTSCMCTVAYIVKPDGSKSRSFGMPGHGGFIPKANEIIKAGETRDIEVVYDPNAHGPAGVGLIDRF